MRLIWTDAALGDLQRLHAFLEPVNPGAAARTARLLVSAPERLLQQPRLGERLDEFAPREVRRIIVGQYEIRYEVRAEDLVVVRLWYTREAR